MEPDNLGVMVYPFKTVTCKTDKKKNPAFLCHCFHC